MSCATSTSTRTVIVRERLFGSHTLLGVFSMPDDLFYPVGVITCIMVFEAQKPHPKNYKTFFGYFKEDGFIKTKRMGRINKGGWDKIKANWLDLYLNREKQVGLSVLKAVTAEEEWCAEAYIDTDYEGLSQDVYANSVKRYLAFRLFNLASETQIMEGQ